MATDDYQMGEAPGDLTARDAERILDGVPTVVARFPSEPEAHMAVARLEAEGFQAMAEPSSVVRVLDTPLAVRPLGVAVFVPEAQAAAAAEFLRAEAMIGEKPPDPGRVILQARDAMWFGIAGILLPALGPLASLWARSTARLLQDIRETIDPEAYLVAAARVKRARWLGRIGTFIFLAILLFLLVPVVFR